MDAVYRRSIIRGQKRNNWLGEILQTTAWFVLFILGVFFAFAPGETCSIITNTSRVSSASARGSYGNIWFRLLGWLAIVFAVWGINRSFHWCRVHRPASRWTNHKQGKYSCTNKNSRKNKSHWNPRPRRFIRETCNANSSWDGSSSLYFGRASEWNTKGRCRSSIKTIFRVDLLQIGYVVATFILAVMWSLLLHDSKPAYYLSPAFFFDYFFLGGLVFYLVFRWIMVSGKWRFIPNILMTAAVVIVLAYLRCWFLSKTTSMVLWWMLCDWIFLSATALVLGYAICVKRLYEY